MRLTTLGTGTASPSTRVNAGHLVEAGAVTLLMDCGSGVAHRMGAIGANWLGITHLAITHFHPDHTLDLTDADVRVEVRHAPAARRAAHDNRARRHSRG